MRKTSIAVIIMISLILLSAAAMAGAAKGIVTGEAGTVAIVRSGKAFPCQPGELLFEGDILKGAHAEQLQVEWHPHASVKRIGPDELQVVYQPPGTMDLAVYKIKEFLGFVEKESQLQYAATRNRTAVGDIFPRPGFKATIIHGYPVTFRWHNPRVKELVIENSGKQIIFKKSVQGKTSVDLRPEEMGLKPGQQFTWRVNGLRDRYDISLLDSETAKQVSSGLGKIDDGAGSLNAKRLHKAAFLQMISDDRPDTVDLYWLSDQLLAEVDAKGDAVLQKSVNLLKSRIHSHFNSML